MNSFKGSVICPLDIKAIPKEMLMPTSFYSEQTPVSFHQNLKIVETMISSDFSFLAGSTALDPSSSSTPALPNMPSSSGSTSVRNKIGVDAACEECTDFEMDLAVEDVITFEQQYDEDKGINTEDPAYTQWMFLRSQLEHLKSSHPVN